MSDVERESVAAADPLKTAGRVAVAAALATTLAAGPVAPETVQLPQVVPIVHTIDFAATPPAPDATADHAADHRAMVKRIIKIALLALAALLVAAALAFGAVNSCTAQLGTPAPGTTDEQARQQSGAN